MKRISIIALFSLMIFFLGCQSLSSNETSTTASSLLSTTSIFSQTSSFSDTSSHSGTTSTQVDTTTSSLFSTDITTDAIQSLLISELERFANGTPLFITADYNLITDFQSEITFGYTINQSPLSVYQIPYVKSASDTTQEVCLSLAYHDTTLSRCLTVTIGKDEELYQYESMFTEAFIELDSQLPEAIVSDFTVPTYVHDNLSVSVLIDNQYQIYNNRFVFPFPFSDTPLSITFQIQYEDDVRNFVTSRIMKGLYSLPKLPEIHIDTLGDVNVTSNEEYVQGVFSLIVYDESLQPQNIVLFNNIQLRLRGNSTLFMPKKSYRIKLEQKHSLLFDHAEYDWVLLANFADQTLIRNYLAMELSRSMNRDFTPEAAFVDVYLNQEYIGNYMLTDQIEVANDRVDITEHLSDLNTGYLLEVNRHLADFPVGVLGYDYFYIYGVPYEIKAPKTDKDYYSVDQLYYIESYVKDVHDALKNHEDYTSLIDEASFIDWFIIEELFKNVDSGYSSVFLQKDKDGLMEMGPVWDFDLSSGNQGHLEDHLRVPEGWYTPLEYKNIWFYYLMQYDSFQENLQTRWNEIYPEKVEAMIESIYPISDSLSQSRYLNFERWDVIGINDDWYTATEVLAADTYQKQIELLYNYLRIRSAWLNEHIND